MKKRLILIGLLAWSHVWLELLHGHGISGEVDHHHRIVSAGEAHIDVTLDLTFHSVSAQRERRQVDANRDGLIEARESKRYLIRMVEVLERGLRLAAGRREMKLTLLHPPELDLLGNDESGAHPIRLRVFCVARLSGWLGERNVVELEDRLWKDLPALCSLQVQSRGRSGRPRRSFSSLFDPGGPRILRLPIPESTSVPP